MDLEDELASKQQIAWNRDNWKRRLESIDGHEILDKLPSPIMRSNVMEHAANARQILIASMVWGYGSTGYGAWRTSRMLAKRPCSRKLVPVDDDLDSIAEAAELGPDQAFSSLFCEGKPKIRGLGVAMGSKFIYFASKNTSGTRSLVYDINVWKAVNLLGEEYSSKIVSPRKYVKSVQYAAYCEWAARVANKNGCDADDVEYKLFRIGREREIASAERSFFSC